MKNTINAFFRFINSLQRPSKKKNMRGLKERGESLESFTIRDVTPADLPALASLHVKAWNQTYRVKNPPTYQIREYQWRKAFEENDGTWFCLVIQNRNGQLIGFAKGKKYDHPSLPGYSGELNKLYLLHEYQWIGLGRKLLGQVARRFLSQGIHSMVLFGIPQNPSCAFHEAMGGKRLYSDKGEFHGGYGWSDLEKLASVCPA